MTETSKRRQYATFSVGDLFFGLEVLAVQEVLRYLEMTSIPLAPDVTEGLINLRGQIVMAIDMRRRLGLPKRKNGEMPMNMVVHSEDGPVSLLVDDIGDVLDVSVDTFEPPPDNMPRSQRAMIEGVYKLDGRLMLALDTERVLQIAAGN